MRTRINQEKSKGMSKRAQITLFMIIGIVIVIGASFLFYLNSKESDKLGNPTISNTGDFENYIHACLKESMKGNMIFLGKQGGRLYASQNGLFDDYQASQRGKFFILNNGINVPYLIDKPQGKEDPSIHPAGESYDSDAGVYPWANFPKKGAATTYVGYFGINRISPLHRIMNGRPTNYSMQEEMESAVLADIRNCDLSVFDNVYELDAGDPSMKVSFNRSIVARLIYPITIIERKTGAKKEYTEFTESIPFRMDSLFAFVAEIIQKDSENITYNMSKATNPEFIVSITKDASNHDDLIEISARNSNIDGKSFSFQFARKNRMPAMEKLDTLTLAINNDILTDIRSQLQSKMYDPDEDVVDISYYIAGGSYGSTLDTSLCSTIKTNGMRVNVSDGEYADYQDFSPSQITC